MAIYYSHLRQCHPLISSLPLRIRPASGERQSSAEFLVRLPALGRNNFLMRVLPHCVKGTLKKTIRSLSIVDLPGCPAVTEKITKAGRHAAPLWRILRSMVCVATNFLGWPVCRVRQQLLKRTINLPAF